MKKVINVRIFRFLLLCLSMSFCVSISAFSISSENLPSNLTYDMAEEMARDSAKILLKTHYDKLRNIRSNAFAFKADFINPNPIVPCDYCVQTKNVSLDEYASDISNRYKNLNFEYEITESDDEIVVERIQKGFYAVTLNVKMTVTGLLNNENTVDEKKRKTTYLTYTFHLDYNNNIFGIKNLTAKQAPGANFWMVELNPNFRIGNPDFGSQDVYAVNSSRAFLTKLGVVTYFNPFGGVNPNNIWLKAGLRVGLLNSTLESDLVDFRTNNIELDGGTELNPHEIDVIYDLSEVIEKQTQILLEIPLGISKRFSISNDAELSLEAEISYSFTITKKTSGTYFLDQLGTNHLLNKDIQSQSGGNPVLYETSPEIVMTSDGELIDFFRSRSEDMNLDDSDKAGYFTFSFRPTVMIRKYQVMKYNIGLNFSFYNVENDPSQIDYNYFNAARTNEVKPLHDFDEAGSRIYAGIVFGLKL